MSRNHSKVMIVGDEEDILATISAAMKKWNIDFEAYNDPLKALLSFESDPSKYLVALTDIRMPGMNGLELASQMLKIKPDLYILLMTAFEITNEEVRRSIPAKKESPVLFKPFSLDQLHEKIKPLLAA